MMADIAGFVLGLFLGCIIGPVFFYLIAYMDGQ